MCREIQTYLDMHHVPYEERTHLIAYTAQEVAHAQHIPGREMAKVVIVKTEEGAPLMPVLPATHISGTQMARRWVFLSLGSAVCHVVSAAHARSTFLTRASHSGPYAEPRERDARPGG
jgi:hypothetical protein